jgi:hypothetical protein
MAGVILILENSVFAGIDKFTNGKPLVSFARAKRIEAEFAALFWFWVGNGNIRSHLLSASKLSKGIMATMKMFFKVGMTMSIVNKNNITGLLRRRVASWSPTTWSRDFNAIFEALEKYVEDSMQSQEISLLMGAKYSSRSEPILSHSNLVRLMQIASTRQGGVMKNGSSVRSLLIDIINTWPGDDKLPGLLTDLLEKIKKIGDNTSIGHDLEEDTQGYADMLIRMSKSSPNKDEGIEYIRRFFMTSTVDFEIRYEIIYMLMIAICLMDDAAGFKDVKDCLYIYTYRDEDKDESKSDILLPIQTQHANLWKYLDKKFKSMILDDFQNNHHEWKNKWKLTKDDIQDALEKALTNHDTFLAKQVDSDFSILEPAIMKPLIKNIIDYDSDFVDFVASLEEGPSPGTELNKFTLACFRQWTALKADGTNLWGSDRSSSKASLNAFSNLEGGAKPNKPKPNKPKPKPNKPKPKPNKPKPRKVHTGPNGGKYYISRSGRKTYVVSSAKEQR